ncbi:MAG: TlyA family RNA methyltransferase [Clostridia bacterium]|nr:TlyA family RNA methyltransferase [Clostridia bacterium]
METEKRLDLLLVELGFFDSRTKAQTAIADGRVSVDGKPAAKASAKVSGAATVSVIPEKEYVGRGAYKLLAAIESFSPAVSGKKCLDIGASTGGFTEVWLEHGAKGVYAVDVGKDQLAPVLKADKRVSNLEKTDVRTLSPDAVGDAELCSIDVSFISLTKILSSPAVLDLYSRGGKIIALVKPQFEAGKSALDKHGVVKKQSDHVRVLDGILIFASSLGYKVSGLIPSPIRGGDGNREYLMYLADSLSNLSTAEIVNAAFSASQKE